MKKLPSLVTAFNSPKKFNDAVEKLVNAINDKKNEGLFCVLKDEIELKSVVKKGSFFKAITIETNLRCAKNADEAVEIEITSNNGAGIYWLDKTNKKQTHIECDINNTKSIIDHLVEQKEKAGLFEFPPSVKIVVEKIQTPTA